MLVSPPKLINTDKVTEYKTIVSLLSSAIEYKTLIDNIEFFPSTYNYCNSIYTVSKRSVLYILQIKILR